MWKHIGLKFYINEMDIMPKNSWKPNHFEANKNYPPKKTNIAPGNEWLEYYSVLLGPGLFSGAFAVSFRECSD